jgi:hypothetical protein
MAMNIKLFLCWSGVVAVGVIVAYVLIEWLKTPAMALVQGRRKEIGFHAIKAEVEAEVVVA